MLYKEFTIALHVLCYDNFKNDGVTALPNDGA